MNKEQMQFHYVELPMRTSELSLYPWNLYVHTRGAEPRIWTLLGSCVSIALFNRSAGMGAICHAQLAEDNSMTNECGTSCRSNCAKQQEGAARFRYLTCSFNHMLSSLNKAGVKTQDLSAYVLGGSEAALIGRDYFKVGLSNIVMARKLLLDTGIRVLQEEIGGNKGRSLYFYPAAGELYFRFHGEKIFTKLKA